MTVKYEYRIEAVATNSTPLDRIVERFNELGADGWIAQGPFPTLSHVLFFRAIGENTNHFHLQPNHSVEQIGSMVKVTP